MKIWLVKGGHTNGWDFDFQWSIQSCLTLEKAKAFKRQAEIWNFLVSETGWLNRIHYPVFGSFSEPFYFTISEPFYFTIEELDLQ